MVFIVNNLTVFTHLFQQFLPCQDLHSINHSSVEIFPPYIHIQDNSDMLNSECCVFQHIPSLTYYIISIPTIKNTLKIFFEKLVYISWSYFHTSVFLHVCCNISVS